MRYTQAELTKATKYISIGLVYWKENCFCIGYGGSPPSLPSTGLSVSESLCISPAGLPLFPVVACLLVENSVGNGRMFQRVLRQLRSYLWKSIYTVQTFGIDLLQPENELCCFHPVVGYGI